MARKVRGAGETWHVVRTAEGMPGTNAAFIIIPRLLPICLSV